MKFAGDPHHDGSPDHVRVGDGHAVLRVRVPGGADAVYVRVVEDGEGVLVRAEEAGAVGGTAWFEASVALRPVVTGYRFAVVRGARYTWLNQEGAHGHEVTDAGDFRLIAGPPPPAWVPGTSVYQVFPDRFARDDDSTDPPVEHPDWALPRSWDDEPEGLGRTASLEYFGGSLDGVRRRLDHLARLGVEVVYLTPVFPARSTHRYNASTFSEVDPLLGGDRALRELVRAAHERGMRVMGDLTTNHTGDAHEWFRTARTDPDSVEAGFYYFTEHPDDYVGWLGVRTLPKLDYASAELRRRVYGADDSVLVRWLTGEDPVDGWRIDVANMTGRHGAQDLNREVSGEIAARMREVDAARGGDGSWLLAEHFHDAGPDTHHDGWHGVMNYAGFTRPVWSWLNTGPEEVKYLTTRAPLPRNGAEDAVRAMRAANAGLPWRVLTHSVNALSTHDSARFRTVVGGDPVRHEVGVAAQVTLPGAPFLFAGDEIGLEGHDGENARRPMPWHRPEAWDRGILDAYTRLLALRRELPALRTGGLRWLDAGPHHMTFVRTLAGQVVLVHLADGPHAPVAAAPADLDAARPEAAASGGGVRLGTDGAGGVVLGADGPGYVIAVGG
ncbi:glycoside hydrolase family 13 protein [Nocardiopsis tropica]|uniref:Glycoside hydrolase family 13 protein n=1 Tax=Nocardiopsis tropica TaxID=109330 RepID=A0ABU7KVL2_9ACTN|nr:glycoside hydrolase family 13 protein [Nocardiopsis umidischolae]MEE2053353.1 glycoside hydrolase family 13 protein [Nocardiopsis umidischolae]